MAIDQPAHGAVERRQQLGGRQPPGGDRCRPDRAGVTRQVVIVIASGAGNGVIAIEEPPLGIDQGGKPECSIPRYRP
jgi:hypothetical protein